jgi:hypothetical protein
MTAPPDDPQRTCPSARCAPGAHLIGLAQPDGRMVMLRTPLAVDAETADRMTADGRPEARMRFADTCQEGRCAQWTGHGCGVIERVLSALAPPQVTALPPCAIRGKCRWYHQEGGDACAVCALVVTDSRAVAAE